MALANLVARDTPLLPAEVIPAVEPIIARIPLFPPTDRPANILVRRRLDFLSNLRTGLEEGATRRPPSAP
jgi:hypothetical protein